MIAAKVVADSQGPLSRLVTVECVYPWWIHAEVLRHRMFSSSVQSTRAVPTKRLLEQVRESPAMPETWLRNQRGMEGGDVLTPDEVNRCKQFWRAMAEAVARGCEELAAVGLHKQHANRWLMPGMNVVHLITATEWSNFFALRIHPAAQPEIRVLAERIRAAFDASTPAVVGHGGWHLPYVGKKDEAWIAESTDNGCMMPDGTWLTPSQVLRWLSVARCARVSTLTHDGKSDRSRDLELAAKLHGDGHLSPLEHQAVALDAEHWKAWSAAQAERWCRDRVPVGNLWGWEQHRKAVAGEHDFTMLRGAAV